MRQPAGFRHRKKPARFTELRPGSEVTLELLRDEERRQVRVTIGTRPPHLP